MTTEYKSEEHEQKTDVQEFVQDLRTFWDRFGMVVLLAVLTVLLLMLASRYLRGREERQREEAYGALATATNPFRMDEVAEDYSYVEGFAGYARLHAADLRLREAMGLMGTDAVLSDEDRAKGLEQAAELYERVIERAESPLQVINARLGLASVRETQNKFDEARKQYEQAIKEAEKWPALAQRAKSRLESLDRISTPVTFPPPKPKAAEGELKEPITVPEIKLDEVIPGLKPEAQPKSAPETKPAPAEQK